jgi:hypothetical protein
MYEFKNYLSRRDGLLVPPEDIKDLFDDSRFPDAILVEVARWLGTRQAERAEEKRPATDLLVYVVTHGETHRPEDFYYLLVDATQENLHPNTALSFPLRLPKVASDLQEGNESGFGTRACFASQRPAHFCA